MDISLLPPSKHPIRWDCKKMISSIDKKLFGFLLTFSKYLQKANVREKTLAWESRC